MQFSTILAATFASLALATPVANPESKGIQKRGVLAELCIAACLASGVCSTPPTCAACLVTCIGTADPGEEVDPDTFTPNVSVE
ncbi:uncharacterized protein DNG_02204 [Cephalotrichum gorgonifer]|uniref:Uncharacterized protein n=1 Tax=Cephalotrichum gorgonifer TaxID=2041049 RepID=A0AAE8MSX5_9PEZI|nr:uncharacterized protein DNG_02204 [Cephalotrichum gorgonifer]